jgi:glycosyltransferase involved in cell wall biosynthesis
MMEHVDYVLAPSGFVAKSFLKKGFREEQILRMFYPVDLSVFKPSKEVRPVDRPFTVVNTGGLSLRKGTPYLLEALRMLRKRIPNMRILLNNLPTESIRRILAEYGDLPIEWSDYLPANKLADRLRSADLFILPSLEEGLVRTALQAMACGVPVVLTPNTGANDYVEEGVNGSVVPIRDAAVIANAAEAWWQKLSEGYRVPHGDLHQRLTHERFQETIEQCLSGVGC